MAFSPWAPDRSPSSSPFSKFQMVAVFFFFYTSVPCREPLFIPEPIPGRLGFQISFRFKFFPDKMWLLKEQIKCLYSLGKPGRFFRNLQTRILWAVVTGIELSIIILPWKNSLCVHHTRKDAVDILSLGGPISTIPYREQVTSASSQKLVDSISQSASFTPCPHLKKPIPSALQLFLLLQTVRVFTFSPLAASVRHVHLKTLNTYLNLRK